MSAIEMNGGIPSYRGEEALHALPYPVIVVDRTFHVVLLNQEARTLLAAPPSAVVGTTIWELLQVVEGSSMERELRRVVATGSRVAVPYFQSAAGRWFNVSANPDTSGNVVISIADASHLRTLEHELDSVERRFCEAFRNAALCMAVADENGWFIEANESFLTLTGYSLEELRTRDFVTITHPRTGIDIFRRV
jgi:PAS domain-containing protein